MLYHPGLLIPEHETAVIDSLKEATMDDLFPVMRPYYRAELLEAIAHEDTKAQKKQQSRLTALGSLAPASAIQWYPLKDIPAETLRILNPLGQLIRDGHEQYVVAVMKGINNVDGSLTLNPEQVDEILQGGPANNVDLIRIGDSYRALKAGGFSMSRLNSLARWHFLANPLKLL
ncbi:hypothetical protein H4R34_001228 [Dimargaris verticillata]|uniref:Uncharacterized protein n=1 Tax=Dimargaris verticillata TaxID=2761393 RepID=A0A9W8BAD2_9FUNG|nr:hypothetical protein H4R34_001228 [Dimargaris verticillata]